MLSGHYFKRLRHRGSHRPAAVGLTNEALLSLLSDHVIDRFARLGKTGAIAVPLAALTPEDEAEDPPPGPCHPACEEHAGSNYCRESWQLHLAELRRRPETHWHKCDYSRFCAIVPIVYQNRCIAAIKLACPASMAEKDFERQVELLDVLARHFAVFMADSLAGLLPDQVMAPEPQEPPSE